MAPLIWHTRLGHLTQFLLVWCLSYNCFSNRLPSPWLTNKSSFGSMPHYSLLHTLGCLCYQGPYMLSPKYVACTLLGYASNYRGNRCFDPVTSKIYTTSHHLFMKQCCHLVSTNSSYTSSHWHCYIPLVPTSFMITPCTPTHAPIPHNPPSPIFPLHITLHRCHLLLPLYLPLHHFSLLHPLSMVITNQDNAWKSYPIMSCIMHLMTRLPLSLIPPLKLVRVRHGMMRFRTVCFTHKSDLNTGPAGL